LRILTAVVKWLFVLCLPFMLVTASIWWAANSHWLYTSGFTRYDVSQTTGLAWSELDKAAAGLIDYFNSPEEFVDITVVSDGQVIDLFTEEEVIHFRDVKRLFRLDFYVLLGTAIYCVAYAFGNILLRQRRYYRILAQGVLGGSVLTLALMLLLGAGTLLDFDQFFLRFHLFAFTNEFWSAQGYMLLLFPRGFWYDAVIYCGAATAIVALILAAVAGGYLRVTIGSRSAKAQVRES
jgi:integral membrane protein (TIGR01906 family)